LISDLQTIGGSALPTGLVTGRESAEQVSKGTLPRRSFSPFSHIRRIAIVVLSALCRTWAPFVLVGALNRIFPVFVSVFFCYAGNERYARHYCYGSSRNFLLWFPSAIGVFRQGKKWGLVCAAPVTEAEFTDPKNSLELSLLLRRLRRIKIILGAERLSFAGILPTILQRRWPETISDLGCDHTPEVVRRAVHQVARIHFRGRPHTVVLLGGAGRIGRAVQESLKTDGINSIVVDPAGESSTFKDVDSTSMLLVDVSRHGVIQRYVPEIPNDAVVLNEVFPEPSREVLTELTNRNIITYHIAGIVADVYPSLPLGYKNALPCCAIHSSDMPEPVLKRIA
jgi:hypothetical protein